MKVIKADVNDDIIFNTIEDIDTGIVTGITSVLKLPTGNLNNILIDFNFINKKIPEELRILANFNINEKECIDVELRNITINENTYENACFIPAEVFVEPCYFMLGLYGFALDNTNEIKQRISLIPLKNIVVKGSYDPDAKEGIVPTPTVFEVYFNDVVKTNEQMEKNYSEYNEKMNDLFDEYSEFVTNKYDEYSKKLQQGIDTIPTKVSELENDAKYITLADVPTNDIKNEIFEAIFPIGRVFIDENVDEDGNGIDYSNYLGFTWEKTLQGVTPVGQKADDTDFATVGKTGGKKTLTLSKANLPNYTLYSSSHSHTFTGTASSHTHTFTGTAESHKHTWTGVSGTYDSNGSPLAGASYDAGTYGTRDTSSTSITPKGTNSSTSITPKGSNSNTTITVTSGGSGEAVNILNPYKVVAFWKRIA